MKNYKINYGLTTIHPVYNPNFSWYSFIYSVVISWCTYPRSGGGFIDITNNIVILKSNLLNKSKCRLCLHQQWSYPKVLPLIFWYLPYPHNIKQTNKRQSKEVYVMDWDSEPNIQIQNKVDLRSKEIWLV